MSIHDEGSATTEDSDYEDVEETQDESGEGSTEDKGEAGKTESQTEDKSSEEKGQEQKDKPELTERGTKLDPDPLSAVNQQLANERAKIRQYEALLNDPKQVKAYAAQFDKTEDKKDEEPEMRVEDIQTTEDLQKYQRQQDKKLDSKLKELDSTISEVKSSQNNATVGSRIQSDIALVRETYPELDPKSDAFNPELDKAVGQLFDRFDFDKKTNSYKGQASLKEIADTIMAAAGSSKKQGSTEAQTQIRDKRTGKATAGATSNVPDESKMTAGQVIANRIKQAQRG